MHRTDARARKHRDRGFRDHRQVDRHAIAALDAEGAQGVRRAAGFAVELPVGEHTPVARFALPEQCRLVAFRAPDVPIETIDRRVQRAAGEPAGVREVPLQHRAPGREPLQLGGAFGPELEAVGLGGGVGGRRSMRPGRKRRGGREAALLVQQGVELLAHAEEISGPAIK